MSDLIDRQAAIDAILKIHDYGNSDRANALGLAECALTTLPPVQPERKKGKWIKEYWNGEHTRKCSACNITQTVTTYRGKVNFNFCPYCGADMRGEEDE